MNANPTIALKNQLINRNRTYADILESLYQTDVALFQPQMVDLIVSLGSLSEYTMLELVQFAPIMNMPIFRSFVIAGNPEDLRVVERQLTIYLTCLATYSNIAGGAAAFVNRFCNLLKMSIVARPVRTASITKATVTLRTNYRPSSVKHLASTPIEVGMILANQLSNAIACAEMTEVDYNSVGTDIKLTGAFLHDLVKAQIQYQDLMQQTGRMFNIESQPYIKDVTIGPAQMKDNNRLANLDAAML